MIQCKSLALQELLQFSLMESCGSERAHSFNLAEFKAAVEAA
jgi:hypothetical protein